MPYLSQESQEFLLSAHPLVLFMCRASLLPPSFSSFSQNFASRICVSMMSFSSAASKASYKKNTTEIKPLKELYHSVYKNGLPVLMQGFAQIGTSTPFLRKFTFEFALDYKNTEFLLVTFVLVNKHFKLQCFLLLVISFQDIC